MLTLLNVQRPRNFEETNAGEDAEWDSDNSNADLVDRNLFKRPSDNIAGQNFLGDFSKRSFDKIDAYSSLGGLGKRTFDRIAGASSLGGLRKKSSSAAVEDGESLPSSDQLEQRMHRAFDRIGGMSGFGGLNKKSHD